MKKQLPVYIAVLAFAVFNGIFSPHSFTVFALQGLWYPPIFAASLNVMFVLSGVVSALLHLLITGAPAAIFERIVPLNRMTTGLVWLAAMLVPTYQTLRHIGWI